MSATGRSVIATCVLVAQSCPALCDPTDCSPPGSSVHGILQARTLEWVAIPFSRRPPKTRIKPGSPALQAGSLPSEPPGKPRVLAPTQLHPGFPHGPGGDLRMGQELRRYWEPNGWMVCGRCKLQCREDSRGRQKESERQRERGGERQRQSLVTETISGLSSPQVCPGGLAQGPSSEGLMLGPVSRVSPCRQSGLCSNAPQQGAAQGGQGPSLWAEGRGPWAGGVPSAWGNSGNNCGKRGGGEDGTQSRQLSAAPSIRGGFLSHPWNPGWPCNLLYQIE